MIVPVILAGGRGERFWPYSNQKQPKQLLPLASNQTLLEDTLCHVSSWKDRGPILIIAAQHLEAPIKALLRKSSFKKDVVLIGEPRARNTAAAIALASKIIQNFDPQPVMAVVTADHAIAPSSALAKAFACASKIARDTGDLVTFGIKPSRPETGYGYIETQGQDIKVLGLPSFKVKRFAEKPALAQAKKFVASGRFFWNSGLFAWRTDVIWKAFENHLPEMYKAFNSVPVLKPGSSTFQANLKKIYDSFEGESIDYGIMEKAQSIRVVIPQFSWDDIGAWSALDRLKKADAQGNRLFGQGVTLDSSNVTTFAKEGLVAVFGLKDILVVQHGAVTLVCPKDKSPDLKKMVAEVAKNPAYKQYL